MDNVLSKVLLIVAGIFVFGVVVIGMLQPAISTKGTEVQTSITNTVTE